jgi:acetyl-CoA carboxylase biotin carboxyl carrier protein
MPDEGLTQQEETAQAMSVEEIKVLIELFERSSLTELTLERGGTRLILKRDRPAPAPAGASAASSHVASAPAEEASAEPGPEAEAELPAGYVVRSPIVGTFYRRPSPDEEPYVEVGDEVRAGDVVCIVEAMKVMNEVRTEKSGVVKEILVEDATPVEYGQPLIVIEPFD